jgi:hypothetical protein
MAVKLLVRQIQHARKTIQEFDTSIAEVIKQHPDAHLSTSLRGADSVLAPRLLSAFGSREDGWKDVDSLAAFSGIAPVTRKTVSSATSNVDTAVQSIFAKLSTNSPAAFEYTVRGPKRASACFATVE